MAVKIYGKSQSDREKYNYVYRITNVIINKHYYGKRSTNIQPHLDLFYKYRSSSTDKMFMMDQEENPNHYKYKVVKCFDTAQSAADFERFIHLKFNVGRNNNFYNRIISGDTPRMLGDTVIIRLDDNTYEVIDKNEFDPEKHTASRKGLVTLWKDNEKISVSVDDKEKFLQSGWNHWMLGKTSYIDHQGKIRMVTKEEADSNGWISKNLGFVPVIDENNNKFLTHKDDDRIGKTIHAIVGRKGIGSYKDADGNIVKLPIDDSRVLSGEFVGITSGNKLSDTTRNAIISYFNSDEYKENKSVQSKLYILYDNEGNIKCTIDTRFESFVDKVNALGIPNTAFSKYGESISLFNDLIDPKTRGNLISIAKYNNNFPNWKNFIGYTYKRFSFTGNKDRKQFCIDNPEYEKYFIKLI
jgi:hypothetical protein